MNSHPHVHFCPPHQIASTCSLDSAGCLPMCLTTRLPLPTLCKFWPQFIPNCTLRILPQQQYRLFQLEESELFPACRRPSALSFQRCHAVTFSWNLSTTSRVNRSIKERDDPNLTFVLFVKNWSEQIWAQIYPHRRHGVAGESVSGLKYEQCIMV